MTARILAALAACAIALAACSATEDENVLDDEPTEQTSTTTGSEEADSDETDDTDAEPADDDQPASEPTELSFGGPIEAGSYSTDVLGTPVTLDLTEDWIAAAGGTAAAIFVDPATEEPTAEVVLLTRTNSFPTAEQVTAEPEGPAFDGDPYDLDAWIDAVGDLIVEDRRETTVDQREATVIDFRLDPEGTTSIPGGCGPTDTDRCVFVAATGGDTALVFIARTTEIYRMWLIEQAAEDPIMVLAIASEEAPEWLDDRADSFVDSLSLGAPVPHPVPELIGPPWWSGYPATVPAGLQMFPALDGVQVELEEEIFVNQDGNCLFFDLAYDGDSPFSPKVGVHRTVVMHNGSPMATVDDFLALYADQPLTATGETLTVLGEELDGYRLEGAFLDGIPPHEFAFSCAVDAQTGSNFPFTPAGFADLFLATTDEGLLAVTAVGFTPEEQASTLDLFDQITNTITTEG